jgi:isoleucyl-tRNA synthetase
MIDNSTRRILVSSCGHGMLKWHYLRMLIGWIIFGRLPVDEIVMHGSLIGLNGKPMSKHLQNSVEPSRLMKDVKDSSLLRFILIRSISDSNIPLQLRRATSEYNRIKPKVDLIRRKNYLIVDSAAFDQLWKSLEICLMKRRVQRAVDQWYTWIRECDIEYFSGEEQDPRPRQLLQLFLD